MPKKVAEPIVTKPEADEDAKDGTTTTTAAGDDAAEGQGEAATTRTTASTGETDAGTVVPDSAAADGSGLVLKSEPTDDAMGVDADGLIDNKWSKNGYGASVEKQSGKFDKEESVMVQKAIEEYCSAKQISVSRLCSECDHKAELKGAWMEIAKRLPHRSVQSVYRHGIRKCHPFKRGAWSDQECTVLTDLVTRLGKKWSAIQSKLNRSADSCRDKYREMSDEFVKGRWKEEEIESLQKLIRDHLNTLTSGATSAIEDMKDLGRFVEEGNVQIPWSVISKRMGKRSRLSCFKKWQKMTGTSGGSNEDTSGGSTTTAAVGKSDAKIDKDGEKVKNVDGDEAAPPAAKRAKGEKSTDGETDAAAAETMVEALELPDTDALAATTTMLV